MKRFDIRKLLGALALALALSLAVPALLPAVPAPLTARAAAKTVKLNKTKATLYLGQTLQLKLNNAKGTVKWKSSKKAVATVSSKGKVTAKKKGSATITATNGKKSYKCKITVKKGLTVSAGSVEVANGKSKTVTVNQKVKGKLTIKTSNAKVATAKWKSDPKVGKNTLVIRAVGPGSATLTITNAATKESLTVKVKVPNSVLVLKKASDAKITIPVREYSWDPFYDVEVWLYSDQAGRDVYAEFDESIVDCHWNYYEGVTDEEYRTLYISGVKAGTTTITISTNVCSETIRIKVTVR